MYTYIYLYIIYIFIKDLHYRKSSIDLPKPRYFASRVPSPYQDAVILLNLKQFFQKHLTICLAVFEHSSSEFFFMFIDRKFKTLKIKEVLISTTSLELTTSRKRKCIWISFQETAEKMKLRSVSLTSIPSPSQSLMGFWIHMASNI